MRALRRAAALVALGGALAVATPALAWDNQGHMATGAIAYDTLAGPRPDLVRLIVGLMQAHPDRARFQRELGAATGAERDRLLFEYMARWPDDIRRTGWDRPDWHYQVRIVSAPGALLAFQNGHAESAFLSNLATARDPKAKPADRAVALCWVFHLVGDMQMPLHAGHWMSARFPLTDRAGTTDWVRLAPGGAPEELHLVWDRAGDQGRDEAAGAAALARKAESVVPAGSLPPEPGDPKAAFTDWAVASRKLAHDVAYDGGRFEGAVDPKDAPVLTPAYLARMHAVAERRIGEGGRRLAALLSGLRPGGAV